MTKTVPDQIVGYIVCKSHRARGRAFGVIGRDRQAYHLAFTDHDMNHHGIYPAATAEEIEQCRTIKGVTKLAARKVPHLAKCW